MESLELVVANLSGATRRETFKGREYLVAPASLLTPGVLNGSEGPLLYPPEDVARNPQDWNHMPIVVYHPKKDGRLVSARQPWVLEKFQIGSVYNARAPHKLISEVWFDVEDTKRVDAYFTEADPAFPAVYPRLERGEPLELSTGLYTKNLPAEPGAVYNGVDSSGKAYSRPYREVATNYRPDHLAVLPDQKGACSISDGCGVFITNGVGIERVESSRKSSRILGGLLRLFVGNWCNQYGGTTCKGSSGGSARSKLKISAPKDKVKAIKEEISKTKEKLASLQAQLKASKADMGKVREQVKTAAGKPSAASIQATSKLAAIRDRAASTALKEVTSGKGISGLKSVGFEPKARKEASDVLEGKGVSPHQVAKQLGMRQSFKSASDAKAAIIRHVVGRAGSIYRSEA